MTRWATTRTKCANSAASRDLAPTSAPTKLLPPEMVHPSGSNGEPEA